MSEIILYSAEDCSIVFHIFFSQCCAILGHVERRDELLLNFTSKINKIRTFALVLIFAGIIIMYIGLFFQANPIVMTIFMLLGFLAIIASTIIYFWIGMMSSKAVHVTCPECGKPTKILGRVDACMNCNEPLTVDPSLEGKEFDQAYNSRKKKQ